MMIKAGKWVTIVMFTVYEFVNFLTVHFYFQFVDVG